MSLQIEVGSLIVPGRGITSVSGPGEISMPTAGTVLNAETAAELMNTDASIAKAFVTGDYPNTGRKHTTTEKAVMSTLMRAEGVALERIEVDPNPSFTSYENLKDAGEFVERYDYDPIGIVSSIGHAGRMVMMARKLYGKKREFVPVPTPEATSVSAHERVLTGIYRVAFTGAFSERALDHRHSVLQKAFNLPKRLTTNGRYA